MAKYCPECGKPVGGEKFCSECGAKIPVAEIPEDAEELKTMIKNTLQKKNFDLAEKCIDRLVEMEPDNFGAWNNKGIILTKNKDFTGAIECFEKAIAISPDTEQVWFSKGGALLEMKRGKEAMEAFYRVLEINPDFKNAQDKFLDALKTFKEQREDADDEEKGEENKSDDKSSEEKEPLKTVECPQCWGPIPIYTEKRPLNIECPNCGAKGKIK